MNDLPAIPHRAHMLVQSLASGSSGNAYLVQTATTTILVDCGVGIRHISAWLARYGLSLNDIDAVFISHEHSDHVRALTSIQRRHLRLMTTAGTAAALRLGLGDHVRLVHDQVFAVGDALVTVIGTSHDAAEPCGVSIATSSGNVAILTDMGCVNDAVVRACRDADLLVIEANHDVDMLRFGPYPAPLKRRVASDLGHLSNRQTGELLADALSDPSRGPRDIWLAHLSTTNNRPSIALETVRRIAGARLTGRALEALPRLTPGPLWSPGAPRLKQLDLFGRDSGWLGK